MSQKSAGPNADKFSGGLTQPQIPTMISTEVRAGVAIGPKILSERRDHLHYLQSADGPDRAQRLASALPDRYVFHRQIGEGGAAYVLLAEDLIRKHLVAVKILRPEVSTAVGEARFNREVTIVRRLRHPNILPLLDYGSAEGHLYFTMPFIESSTLAARLERERQLSLADTHRILRDIASALDYAHTLGVIHRDIKPANVLLTGGRAVVADFGIARAIAVETSEAITASGVSLGTPEYMSPEQGGGIRELDLRCDVYALGCVAYEMLAGEPPFTGRTEQTIIARHCSEPPRPVRTVRPEIPPAMDQAILKALAKLRAQRFQRAGEFVDAFGSTRGML